MLARQNQPMFTANYKLEGRNIIMYFLSARFPDARVGKQYWLSFWGLRQMPCETF